MSTVTLAEVKRYVKSVHDEDDIDLQEKIDEAEQWAMDQMRTTTLEVLTTDIDVPTVPASVKMAIKMHVCAHYGEPDPDKAAKWMAIATDALYPHKASEICA